MRALLTVISIALVFTLINCEREQRQFRPNTASVAAGETGVQQSPLHPGAQEPLKAGESESPANNAQGSFENNAYGVAEGQKLYESFNCSGCHFHGGGGIGPPLMDANWVYGSRPENIFETIAEGRPNGMPAFGRKIATDQIWQLVAYVRSLSGLLPKDIAPGRGDNMQVRSQEQQTEKAQP